MEFLIVALGNPGVEYELTRHNIGWLTFDNLSFENDLIWKEKFKGVYASKSIGDNKYYFLKPQTFMNLSGDSVQALTKFFKIPVENILVVHDELDLAFGQIGFKKGGGLAGHNGLKSIAKMMGSQDFKRLRLGISRPTRGDVANWVLTKFSQDQFDYLGDYLKGSAEAVESYIKNGFEKASNQYSKKKIVEEI